MKFFLTLAMLIFSVLFLSADEDGGTIVFKKKLDQQLYQMIRVNNAKGVKSLIVKGADVNSVDRYKLITPLIAASKKGYIDIIAQLIKGGAKVNMCVTLGNNALASAAGNGKLNAVKYLIEHGAEVNLAKGYRETPLMHASLHGEYKVVKYLVENGANINLQNIEGVTALMFAVQSSKKFRIVKYLVNKGADLNIKNKKGGTALSWAGKNKRIFHYLKSKGAKM